MICKRCMVVMSTGTTYERKKVSKPSHRRFYECKCCKDKVYVNSPNFQEIMKKESEKSINK